MTDIFISYARSTATQAHALDWLVAFQARRANTEQAAS
jgi:hypothetical protein